MAGYLRFSAFQRWFRIENRKIIKVVMVIPSVLNLWEVRLLGGRVYYAEYGMRFSVLHGNLIKCKF